MSRFLMIATLATVALPAVAQDVLVNRPSPCTQLESSVGLVGDQCGILSLQEIGELRTAQEQL